MGATHRSGSGFSNMKLYAGTSGYAYKEWKGAFYPEKLPSKDMLRFYSERLDVVEINNTFYQLPKRSVLTSWAEQVPDEFLFALKASRRITHIKRLEDVRDETEYLFDTLQTLEGKLGPVLFQFPKSFRVDRGVLEDFLRMVPDDVRCAFAFRNPSWLNADILGLLRDKGRSLCIEDTDEEPAGEITSTASWGYLRLRRIDYTEAELAQWAERIDAQGWNEAFVFFKHEDEANAPLLAARFREVFEKNG